MGEGGALRHVVHRRVHLERAQPAARKKLGHLEKHKDYVKRAKDFHKKEDAVKLLQRKAYFKNADEFSFGMVSRSMDQAGHVRKKHKHDEDAFRLLESQDARYIRMREQIDKKAVEKRSEQLHFLDADRPNKHTIFVDDDELEGNRTGRSASSAAAPSRPAAQNGAVSSLKEFDVATYLDTHHSLLGRKANRPTRKQLETGTFAAQTEEGEEATRRSYRELLHRQERAKKLGQVREQLDQRQDMRGKGKRKKISGGGDDGAPTVYKWFPDRKK